MKCTAGLYYDNDKNMISRAEAIKTCLNHDGQMLIKPSINSNSSKNVFVIDPNTSSENDIDFLFEKLGAYFIVQHRIEQHMAISKLNPDTVNIIRANSLLIDK